MSPAYVCLDGFQLVACNITSTQQFHKLWEEVVDHVAQGVGEGGSGRGTCGNVVGRARELWIGQIVVLRQVHHEASLVGDPMRGDFPEQPIVVLIQMLKG